MTSKQRAVLRKHRKAKARFKARKNAAIAAHEAKKRRRKVAA